MTGSRAERVSAWTRPALRDLKPYYKAPVAPGVLRMDQNTHLLGPNPALAKVDPADLDLTQYPSRDADGLLVALAAFHGLAPENFTAGNGSDETLDIACRAFTEPGDVLATATPTYSLYPLYAKLHGLKAKEIPLRAGFQEVDVEGIARAKPRLTILASPNNPTGARILGGVVEDLLSRLDGVLLLDEAYIEYAGVKHSFLRRVEEFDNLVVLRTFSKAYALAGLRVGYLAANRLLTERLRLAKPPFNLGVWPEAVAVAALREQAWLESGVARVREERELMADALRRLGFRVHPSEANFLLTDPPMDAGELLLRLRERGILARTFPQNPPVRNCIRFTVGGPEHTDRLVAALRSILEAAS